MTPTPKKPDGWAGFFLEVGRTFGVPTAILVAMMGGLAYTTPKVLAMMGKFVDSTLETQQSVAESQRDIAKSQEQIARLVENIDESTETIMTIEEKSKVFMETVLVEHSQNQEEHQAIMEEHKVQMEKLTNIETTVLSN